MCLSSSFWWPSKACRMKKSVSCRDIKNWFGEGGQQVLTAFVLRAALLLLIWALLRKKKKKKGKKLGFQDALEDFLDVPAAGKDSQEMVLLEEDGLSLSKQQDRCTSLVFCVVLFFEPGLW